MFVKSDIKGPRLIGPQLYVTECTDREHRRTVGGLDDTRDANKISSAVYKVGLLAMLIMLSLTAVDCS